MAAILGSVVVDFPVSSRGRGRVWSWAETGSVEPAAHGSDTVVRRRRGYSGKSQETRWTVRDMFLLAHNKIAGPRWMRRDPARRLQRLSEP